MITPQELLAAYTKGYFPMAKSREDPAIYWYYPEERGIIPLTGFHIPKSLAKDLRKAPFDIRINTAFPQVIRACAEAREDTWINDTIIRLYTELHWLGFAHSVEAWRGETLAGGLYGLALGGAFFGESMFSHETNASKAALVALVERIRASGYTLLDAQYVNEHLKQFGITEISRAEYLTRLNNALATTPIPCF